MSIYGDGCGTHPAPSSVLLAQGFKISQKTRCPPLSLPPSSTIPSPGWGPWGWGWSATLAEKLADPPPRPGRRDSRGGQGAEPALGDLLRGGGGGPHGPSRFLCLWEVLATAVSVVSTWGLGSAGAWDAQSRAGAAWASPWGAPRWVARWGWARGGRRGAARLGGAVLPQPQRWGRTGGLRRPSLAGGEAPVQVPAPPRRSLCCRRGSRARCCQVGSDSGVVSRIWGRPPAPLSPRANQREKAPSSLEPFLPGFLLGNRSADPSLGPAVAGELSVTWILKYFRDTCLESGSESVPRL